MDSYASGNDQFDMNLCNERHANEKEHRESTNKRIDKVDAKLNALILFLISTVVGILIYVGQSMFTKVFVTAVSS